MDLFGALIDTPTVDTRTKTTTSESQPFPRSSPVTSIGSSVGTLLLNKKIMFLLKLQKLPGALKLLLFTV